MANKATLIEKVQGIADLNKKQATEAVEAVFDGIRESLEAGESTTIVGFGTFSAKHRAARKGRNPQTGEEIDIPAANVPAFKASPKLKNDLKA